MIKEEHKKERMRRKKQQDQKSEAMTKVWKRKKEGNKGRMLRTGGK